MIKRTEHYILEELQLQLHKIKFCALGIIEKVKKNKTKTINIFNTERAYTKGNTTGGNQQFIDTKFKRLRNTRTRSPSHGNQKGLDFPVCKM